MNQEDDVLFVLSMAVEDARHHVLYNQKTGFTSQVVQRFVETHFNSDLVNYDDTAITAFFEAPSEIGLRALYKAARLVQPDGPNGDTGVLFRRFVTQHAFGIPHLAYAYRAILLTRRFALEFFYLIEQYCLNKRTSTFYDDALRPLGWAS